MKAKNFLNAIKRRTTSLFRSPGTKEYQENISAIADITNLTDQDTQLPHNTVQNVKDEPLISKKDYNEKSLEELGLNAWFDPQTNSLRELPEVDSSTRPKPHQHSLHSQISPFSRQKMFRGESVFFSPSEKRMKSANILFAWNDLRNANIVTTYNWEDTDEQEKGATKPKWARNEKGEIGLRKPGEKSEATLEAARELVASKFGRRIGVHIPDIELIPSHPDGNCCISRNISDKNDLIPCDKALTGIMRKEAIHSLKKIGRAVVLDILMGAEDRQNPNNILYSRKSQTWFSIDYGYSFNSGNKESGGCENGIGEKDAKYGEGFGQTYFGEIIDAIRSDPSDLQDAVKKVKSITPEEINIFFKRLRREAPQHISEQDAEAMRDFIKYRQNEIENLVNEWWNEHNAFHISSGFIQPNVASSTWSKKIHTDAISKSMDILHSSSSKENALLSKKINTSKRATLAKPPAIPQKSKTLQPDLNSDATDSAQKDLRFPKRSVTYPTYNPKINAQNQNTENGRS